MNALDTSRGIATGHDWLVPLLLSWLPRRHLPRRRPVRPRLARPAVVAPAAAATTPDDAPADVVAKIKAVLTRAHSRPAHRRDSSLSMAGLYEVNTGQELVYTNDSATLVFVGRIVDTKSREDLTAKRWNDLNAIDFDKLPFDLALKSVRGDGSRKVAGFRRPVMSVLPAARAGDAGPQTTSPSIRFCTRWRPSIRVPPSRPSPIWCSKDRQAAWSKWMLQKVRAHGRALRGRTGREAADPRGYTAHRLDADLVFRRRPPHPRRD